MEYRTKGINCISKFLTIKSNIDALEKYIYKAAASSPENTIGTYNSILYQVIGDLIKKNKLNSILLNLKHGKNLWDHQIYKDSYKIMKEFDDFTIDPYTDVAESVFKCFKCGSKKIFTYSKQTRSSDEPSTVFSTCVVCKTKWVYSG